MPDQQGLAAVDLRTDPARRRAVGEQLLQHHAELRAELARVRSELDGPVAISRDLLTHCLTFCDHLHMHHSRENGAFGAVRAAFPGLASALERLRAEHQVVALALNELRDLLQHKGSSDVLRAEFTRLAKELEDHFRYEEEQLLPSLMPA